MGVTRRTLPAVASVAALLAVGIAPAEAHDVGDLIPAGAGESEIRAIETAVLGAEHAAEHAAARKLERRAARGKLPQETARAALSSEDATVARAGPPAEVGEWTQAPFALPTYAINSVMLPTGKVLFWGRPPPPGGGETRPNVGEAAIWDPSLGTGPAAFTDVDPPVIDVDGPGGQPPAAAPIFCSGQSLLPSGEVLIAGGTLAYEGTLPDDPYTFWAGLPTAFTFDPWTETWTQQPDMADGRWYPTQAMLPDGRTIVAGGYNAEPPGGVESENLEVFNPAAAIGGQGSFEQKPSADRVGIDLYPRLFSLRDGNLLMAGPYKPQVAILDTDSFTWDESPSSMSQQRLADNAFRRPLGPAGSDTVTAIGGFNRPGVTGPFYPATETSETIDAASGDLDWTASAPLNVARANSNTVLLPDGSMVVVGGGSGFMQGGGGGYVTYADGRARQVELYDPDTDSWVLGPAQQEDRAYHSTAVLLPDGRIFSAGDDHSPIEPGGGASLTDNGEIYSPPYLFKGPRPVIDSAPQAVDWGDDFGIESASPGIERAVLVAPSATTHGVDMNQRHVELQVLDNFDGEGVNVLAPLSAGVAPPGHYMLFLLDETGVPSVASWIEIDPSAPDQPTLGPPPEPPAGDFNGDGYADRAVGAPLEDLGAASDAGAVNVLYGAAGALTDAGNQLFSQDDVGGEAAESGDRFGSGLAVGDFNDDGFADLAVGAPGEDAGSTADTGTVNVLYGSSSGLTATGAQGFSQGSGGIADSAEAGDEVGTSLAAGDLDGDGDDDLSAGAPGESIGTATNAGAVNVIYGSGGGLSAAANQLWSQNSTDIADKAETGDRFGAALAVGDLDGDGDGDLSAGVPGEAFGTNTGAGAVNVLYGSPAGLSSTANQLWAQNSAGIADGPNVGDAFGAALAAGDLDGDGDGDLLAGAPGESVGTAANAGLVHAIYGSGAGLSSAGSQHWGQNSAAIADKAETGDRFGAALAAGDLDGDGDGDLIAGVPGESVGTLAGAGAANVIHGSGAGLSSAANQLWHQNSAGISETAETNDAFGSALAADDLNGDLHADLAVGVPAETIGAITAGGLNLIYGSATGLSSAGNQLWSQDSPNVLDLGETGDQFGATLGAGAG